MQKSIGILSALVMVITPLTAASAAGVTKSQIASAIEGKGYHVAEENAKMLSVAVGEHQVVIAVDGSDADGDDDQDMRDFANLQRCFLGTGGGLGWNCIVCDSDNSLSIDAVDSNFFFPRLTGPN